MTARRKREWFDDEAFWRAFYPFMFPRRRIAAAAEEVARVLDLTFHHTIYSGQELRDRMEQAGFADVRLYGNLDGDPYGPGSPRLIAVGRRPAGRASAPGQASACPAGRRC